MKLGGHKFVGLSQHCERCGVSRYAVVAGLARPCLRLIGGKG